jgi:tetratricopeptide (TPR) repeat protein
LTAADGEAPLEPEDLVLLAQAAQLIGKEAEGADCLARAHQTLLSRGDAEGAARCAFWLGFRSTIHGETSKGSGWLSRANRLLEGRPDCVEHGYLLVAAAYRSFHEGDAVTAQGLAEQAAAFGERFGDKDLMTFGLQGQGRSLIRQGAFTRGVALLDEAMIAVTAGEISVPIAGGVYCSVLEACSEMFDLRRAQEWTSALDQWCASLPDLVPFRGHCLVRRSEFLQLHGAWTQALELAEQASQWLSSRALNPDAGAAFYQVGEIYRLRGKFAESEEAYRQASQFYRCPGPGAAQLRLAQGRVDAANTMIRRLAEEVRETRFEPGYCRRTPRLFSPPMTLLRRAPQRLNWWRLPDSGKFRSCRRYPRAFAEPCCWLRARLRMHWRSSGNRGVCGLTSKRPTRPHGRSF